MAAGVSVVDVTAPEGSGMSSETLLFTVEPADGPAERYVARLAPLASQQFPVFPEYDLELQRKVMQTVAVHTDVPVPEVLTHETDPEWLGSPFLLMRRVDGIVPSDIPPYTMAGWLFDAAPDDQRKLEREAVRVLARLHALTPERHDLAFLDRPQFAGGALDQHLELPALVLRLGARGPARAADRADLRRARQDPAARRTDRPQLGRQPHRQHDVPRLRAGRGARLGDGRPRARRDRRGVG